MKKKIILALLIIITIFRIFLASKIPLIFQADAIYDDYMFIDKAISLLKLDWFGSFNYLTYAKVYSYSIFLVINYILGIPYSVHLIILYIIAIILFLYSIKNILNNNKLICIMYIILLYSPVMFHEENVQKIYRGGLLIVFSIFVISGIINIFNNYKNKNRLIKWSIFTSIVLSFFWFIKEDSIWILPFVLTASVITIIKIFYYKVNKTNIIYCLLPLFTLFISITTYSTINYIKYGEYGLTDRNNTYFKEVINDLLLIEDKNNDQNIWISKKMFYKAIEVSPSLKSMENEINKMYDSFWINENGEIHGDIINWAFKETVNNAGYYKSGKKVNKFYKNVHQELQIAFKTKKLKKNDATYIVDLAKGVKKQDIKKLKTNYYNSFLLINNYNENITSLSRNTGSIEKVNKMEKLTNTPKSNSLKNIDKIMVKLINNIVNVYKYFGLKILCISIIGFICYLIINIKNIINKTITENELSIFLIILGLLLTILIQLFGVVYFSRFLGSRKIYDYSSLIIPFLEFIKMYICYYLFNKIYLQLYKNVIKSK